MKLKDQSDISLNLTFAKRLPMVTSEDIEASSSGRVSAAFVHGMSDAPAPGLSFSLSK